MKSWAREMVNPTDKVHKTKNRVNKDKVLNAKSPLMFKEIIRKRSSGFNPSGYL